MKKGLHLVFHKTDKPCLAHLNLGILGRRDHTLPADAERLQQGMDADCGNHKHTTLGGIGNEEPAGRYTLRNRLSLTHR